MTFIQARVRDAERRQEGVNSELIRLWLRKLKQVLYRADDLFDHVLTLDRQNPRVERSTLAKVGVLFSKSSPFLNNRRLAHEIKSIRKDLDEIKANMDGLNLSANLVVGLPLPMERLISNRQKGSFVKVEDVIGREHDKNNIIEMLFDPKFDDGKRITVIPIVGFGGLGKTTLAQLIYNDEIVRKHFDLTNWVCVPEVGDQNTVMKRVYQSFTGDKDSDRLLVGQIKSGIQGSINNKKYLLVVDDIWDENRNSWLDLLMLLECGASGSRVIVNISIDGWKAIVSLLAARKIQSFMLSGSNNQCDIKSSSLEVMFLKFQSLRVLDLRNLNISMVPGKLRHLRYLNLAMNFRIRSLPDDLARLQNLQTLDLGYCSDLIQLPKDFYN